MQFRRMKAKVIRTEKEYQAALAHVEKLMTGKGIHDDELELWSLLIEKYEEEHFPIELPDPIEAIRFRMEQEGLKPVDLQHMVASKSKVSEVLNYKRPLSLSMIRAFKEGLDIPADVLLRESPVEYGVKTKKSSGKK